MGCLFINVVFMMIIRVNFVNVIIMIKWWELGLILNNKLVSILIKNIVFVVLNMMIMVYIGIKFVMIIVIKESKNRYIMFVMVVFILLIFLFKLYI